MKRISALARFLLVIMVLIGTGGAAMAVDFGGTFNNLTAGYTDLASKNFVPDQEDTLSAWFSAPIGQSARFYAEGFYQFKDKANEVTPYLFDVSQFYLKTNAYNVPNGPVNFEFAIGRVTAHDISGYILNGLLDGAQFTFAYPGAQISLVAGYTGLVLKPDSTVLISQLDSLDLSNDSVVLGPSRLVGSFALQLPHLFAYQSIGLDVIFQKDLRPASELISPGTTMLDVTGGGATDTQYVGLKLDGPILPNLFYSVFSYLNTGRTLSYEQDSSSSTGFSYKYEPILAYAGGLRVNLYPGFLNSQLGLSGVYSTGDTDAIRYLDGNTKGDSNTFIPINQEQYSLIFTPQLGNLARVGLNFSVMPFSGSTSQWLSTLQAEVKGFGFFRPVGTQPTSVGTTPALPGSSAAENPYLGSEIDVYIRVRPYSDLGLELQSAVFLPKKGQSGSPFPQDEPLAYQVGLRCVLSF